VAPDVLLSPPSRSFTSPSNEEKNKGFERFISLLNKGVVTNLKDTVRPAQISSHVQTSVHVHVLLSSFYCLEKPADFSSSVIANVAI